MQSLDLRIIANLLSWFLTFKSYLRIQGTNICIFIFSFSSFSARFLQGNSFCSSIIHINVFSLCSIPPVLQIKHLTCNLKAFINSNSPSKPTSGCDAHKKLPADDAQTAQRMGPFVLTELTRFLHYTNENCPYHDLVLYEECSKNEISQCISENPTSGNPLLFVCLFTIPPTDYRYYQLQNRVHIAKVSPML